MTPNLQHNSPSMDSLIVPPVRYAPPSTQLPDRVANVDIQRVVKGFRLAGVPESLFRGEFAARNRLKADELRTLLLGHRFHGRSAESGEEHSASFTTDGVATPRLAGA